MCESRVTQWWYSKNDFVGGPNDILIVGNEEINEITIMGDDETTTMQPNDAEEGKTH